MTNRQVEAKGVRYELRFQPVRTSLSDDDPTMWAFQCFVVEGDEERALKICYVGRTIVKFRHPEALTGPPEELWDVLYDLIQEKIVKELEEGTLDDGAIFV